jgi:hypothetical protein
MQIYDQLQTEPRGEVVAVGRVYESGKLIATGGTLTDKPSELDCEDLKMSTCKITKVLHALIFSTFCIHYGL